MKIGILTFHFSNNYGALLQAYCLQQYLLSIGHDVEFINYHPYYVEQGGSISEILKPAISRRYLKKVYLFVNSIKQRLLSNPEAIASLDAFRYNNLCISSDISRSSEELQACLGSYDHIILGSDQIWNPSDQYGLDPVYFGHPYSAKVPVSSYAASFGSIERISPLSSLIVPFLRNLSNCSVREQDASSYLSSLGIDSSLVPDPTLLIDNLDAFKRLPDGINLENSIFTYALRSSAGVREAAIELSSELKLQLISAYTPWRRWKRIGFEISLDPFSFLGAISSSRVVVSNSFHGIVCSILLKKQFIAIALPGAKAGLSSRVYSFLHSVGLEDRLLFPGSHSKALEVLSREINWTMVSRKLSVLQGDGRKFLSMAFLDHEEMSTYL